MREGKCGAVRGRNCRRDRLWIPSYSPLLDVRDALNLKCRFQALDDWTFSRLSAETRMPKEASIQLQARDRIPLRGVPSFCYSRHRQVSVGIYYYMSIYWRPDDLRYLSSQPIRRKTSILYTNALCSGCRVCVSLRLTKGPRFVQGAF